MKDPLTHSLNGLHTWSGLLFGWLLFAIFLMGTLTIFDTEITSWMQPESQVVISSAGVFPAAKTGQLQHRRDH